jgi:Flp pilus assembly protein TadG
MRIPSPVRTRRGVTLVEAAIVLSATLLILIGMTVGGLGVFRYHQVAALAREGARYAVVHGTQFQKETGGTAASGTDIKNNAILPMAAGLNPGSLMTSVSWTTNNAPTHDNTNSNPPGQAVTNIVSVTVSYQWIPEAYFGGVTLTSTSQMPMAY